LEDVESSNQNQLYRFVANELTEPAGRKKQLTPPVREKVEKVLARCEIILHVYPLMDFDASQEDIHSHRESNRKVKEFEKHVIRIFRNRLEPKFIINKQDYEPRVQMRDLFPGVWTTMKSDFFGEEPEPKKSPLHRQVMQKKAS